MAEKPSKGKGKEKVPLDYVSDEEDLNRQEHGHDEWQDPHDFARQEALGDDNVGSSKLRDTGQDPLAEDEHMARSLALMFENENSKHKRNREKLQEGDDHDIEAGAPKRFKHTEGDTPSEPPAAGLEEKINPIRRPKAGKTRGSADELEFQLEDGSWIPAVWHESIRRRLIEKAAKAGEWRFDWGHSDEEEDDITSYDGRYELWGPARENWPEILFRYRPGDLRNPDYPVNVWYDEGRIVLGPGRRPVLKWQHLPATISAFITPAEMEALWRLDRRSTTADFIALYYNTKKARERTRMCCRSWDGGPLSQKINAFLDQILPEEYHKANSTKGFRKLTAKEIRGARMQNKRRPRISKTEKKPGKQAVDKQTHQATTGTETQKEEDTEPGTSSENEAEEVTEDDEVNDSEGGQA
ncbi:MAG: hypothetical protein Q9201_000565 [Fulgogasparrea decipioides]